MPLKRGKGITDCSLKELERNAPHFHTQLLADSEDQELDPESFVARLENGLEGYVSELSSWCQVQLFRERQRAKRQAIAALVREQGVVPAKEMCDLLGRYQTTLDNQLANASGNSAKRRIGD